MAQHLRTTCNRDCPDSCGVIATVENGRIVKHRGDPDHPVTRGFLCLRGNRYLRRFYSEERILHPMRRNKGGWQRVGWDDALDLAAERLSRCRDEHGPESVLAVSYSGIKGLVAMALGKLFWAHFGGPTVGEGGLSVEAAFAAQELDFGGDGAHAPHDLANAKAVVVWGKNIDVTRPHAMAFVTEARRAGAPMHVIDPVRCATARKAHRHHALRPGSDPWLALGIGKLLVERDAVDHAFVRDHTEGFEEYRRLLDSVSLEQVAAATDLPVSNIEELAELYASTRPLATLIGLGPSWWPHAGVTVRLIDALAAICGNLGIPGGGAQTDSAAGYAGTDFSILREAPAPQHRKVLLPHLGQAVLEASDPPIRAGWIAGANPAATCPDTARVNEALASLDFLVVVDQFITASAEHADLFLPCTTYLEMEDVVVAYGHHYIGGDQAVVPPLGEARPDAAIYQALAGRLGFGDVLAGSHRGWARRILGTLATEHGITPERLVDGAMLNPLAPPIPFAGGEVGTPSGKVQLITSLDDMELSGSPGGGRLFLMATKTLKMVNAQINPEDLPDEPVVRLHPEALAARELSDGQRAWVVSDAGRVRVQLKADDAVRTDVLLFNPAAWRGDLQGVNQLRQATLTDIGQAPAMHHTLVTLET